MSRIDSTKLIELAALAAFFSFGCSVEEDLITDEEAEVLADDADDPDVIELDGLSLRAPPAGSSVWTERMFDDGTTQQLMLHTDADGLTYIEELGDVEALADAPNVSLLSQCDDGAYSLLSHKWTGTLKWYFHSGSTPGDLNVDSVETNLKAGMSNITGADNACNMTDDVSAAHAYQGRKAKGANIGANGGCTTNDGVNMVSFGDLPAGTLGVACTWFSNGAAIESDIKFNKVDHKWTTSPGSASCSNRFSVQAVMTHEAGHAFGLGHVSEASHGNLTMSTQISPCQNSETTLGKGDVLGLRVRY